MTQAGDGHPPDSVVPLDLACQADTGRRGMIDRWLEIGGHLHLHLETGGPSTQESTLFEEESESAQSYRVN